MAEFDFKDMITKPSSSSDENDFVYSAAHESALPYNIMNSFK